MKFTHSPLLAQQVPSWRGRLVLVLLLLAFTALVARSAFLQGVHREFLQQKGESRYSRVMEMPATRGRVLDRHGDVLAVSTPVKSVAANPEAAELSPAQARQLAKLLEMDVREINARLATDREFVFLKRQIPPDTADKVAAMKLPGIQQQPEYRRYYPSAEVAAHVLGFTGAEDMGQEGVELAYDKVLAGKPGSRRVIKDRRGQIVEDVESIRQPQDGREINLAIDGKLQYLAYVALKQAVAENRAKAGSIVVVDPRSGEVLALVNLPAYNPNNRVKLSGAQLRNRALTDTFEPGSTFKPFTAALALEQGKFRPDTPIQTAPGRLTIGTATVTDAHPHGMLTVAEVVQKSSNVGTAKMAATLSARDMWQMYGALGFGAAPGLGFPGEATGRLRPYKSWRPIEQATMSFGYGVAVSLTQLAHAYTVFARDGDLVPLSLTRVDGELPAATRVYSARTVKQVRAMLEMAVQNGGTAPKAQIPGYRVGGKTGTARKLDGGNYVERYVSSFVGFAPVSDPRLVVAVMIDDPAGDKYYGGEVAAPAFAQVMAGALRTLGVKPDAPLAPLQVAKVPAIREGL